MRRALVLTALAVAALTTAGVAAATLGFSGTQTVTATFSAARDRADTKTCTGSDGTYEIVKGRYTGEADSSVVALDGPLTLHVTSVYNTTEGVGWITGSIRVRRGGGSDDRNFDGRLVGTLTAGSGDIRILDGFATGRIGGRYADVAGNVTASFTAAGGFANGKLGEGGANIALMVGKACTKPAPLAVHLVVRGEIETLSDTSISVKPKEDAAQTCAIKSGTSPSTSRFERGDNVEMRCGLVGGVMTLLKLSRKGGDD